MTIQFCDTLVYDARMFGLFNYPLEPYLKSRPSGPYFARINTATMRGYIARWHLLDNRLYLTHLRGRLCLCSDEWRKTEPMLCDISNNGPCTSKDASLGDLFPVANQKVFADWFTGELHAPAGPELKGNGLVRCPRYEKYLILKFRNGCLLDERLMEAEEFEKHLRITNSTIFKAINWLKRLMLSN